MGLCLGEPGSGSRKWHKLWCSVYGRFSAWTSGRHSRGLPTALWWSPSMRVRWNSDSCSQRIPIAFTLDFLGLSMAPSISTMNANLRMFLQSYRRIRFSLLTSFPRQDFFFFLMMVFVSNCVFDVFKSEEHFTNLCFPSSYNWKQGS